MNEKDKNKIIEYINKIEQYARQYPWLLEELQCRFGNINNGFSSIDRERLRKVEQYLSLDYDFQKVAFVAGYDYIDIPQLKEKLVMDWREMLRYRYGIAARPISFVNFCSYAHFQAEGIVNYYHYKRDHGVCDVDWFNANIDEYIKKHDNFKLNSIPRTNNKGCDITLEDVNYNIKKCVLLNIIYKNFNINKSKQVELSMVLSYIQKIRNTEAVHRYPYQVLDDERCYSFEAIEYTVSEFNNIVRKLHV